MILTSFVSLKHCITTFRRCQVWFLILILRTTARSETKFVLVSVFIWLYTWNKYLQIFVRSHAPYAAHFIRYIITTMFDFAGLEPVTHLPLQSVFPLTPSVNINRLYSSNLKPQVTVVMIIFERSRASGSNRSTWKMKKMWLVAQLGLEPRRFSATDFESASYTKFRHWAL